MVSGGKRSRRNRERRPEIERKCGRKKKKKKKKGVKDNLGEKSRGKDNRAKGAGPDGGGGTTQAGTGGREKKRKGGDRKIERLQVTYPLFLVSFVQS